MSLTSRTPLFALLLSLGLPGVAVAAGEHERFQAQLKAGHLRSADMVLQEWGEKSGQSQAQYFVDRAELSFARADLVRAGGDGGGAQVPGQALPDAEQWERKGADILGEAARLFPLRLDILVTRAGILQDLTDYVPMMETLEAACKIVGEREEDIRWALDVPYEVARPDTPSDFLPATLQAMMRRFTDWETEEGDSRAEAIAVLAVEHFPEHPFGHNSLGVLLALRGEYGGAVQALQRASELSPRDVMVLSNLSRCRHANGDIKGALADLKSALAITEDPETKQAIRARIKSLKNAS